MGRGQIIGGINVKSLKDSRRTIYVDTETTKNLDRSILLLERGEEGLYGSLQMNGARVVLPRDLLSHTRAV